MDNEINISKGDMKKLAESFEDFLEFRDEIMYIPKELDKDGVKRYKEAVEIVRQLIKKLNKGSRSVFKDYDSMDYLC